MIREDLVYSIFCLANHDVSDWGTGTSSHDYGRSDQHNKASDNLLEGKINHTGTYLALMA